MKKFNIWGSFTIEVDFNINAENEKEAERKAKDMINERYLLDSLGDLHVAKSQSFRLLIDDEDQD